MKVPQGVKRCKCRENGRELGAGCPRLRRRDGSWNPAHGTWQAVSYLPAPKGAQRARLRAGGFATQADLARWFTAAHELLAIPDDGAEGHKARLQVLDLIHEARDSGTPLPAAADIRRRYATGSAFAPGEAGAYLLAWLSEHEQAGHWTHTTAVSYRGRVEKLFLPAFGTVPLDKLSTKHVLGMFAAIDAESDRIRTARASADPAVRKTAAGKRPTGIATKRRILAVLSSALGDACSAEKRLLTVNVADGIKFGRHQKGRGSRVQPKLWTPERESSWKRGYEKRVKGLGPREQFEAWRSAPAKPGPVMVWRPDQLGAFLDAARSSRLYALFCLLSYGALRRGEACGLRWEETDLNARRVLVGETTVVQVGKRVLEQDEAKTDDSKDWLTIADEAVTPLQAWRMQQEEERIAWGDAWQDSGYCFTLEDGTVVRPDQVSGAFERIAHGAGLPPVTLRDLRHCAPTYALAAGEDIKVVSAMMRHTSVKITADIYALVLPDLAASVSRSVASMVPRGTVRN